MLLGQLSRCSVVTGVHGEASQGHQQQAKGAEGHAERSTESSENDRGQQSPLTQASSSICPLGRAALSQLAFLNAVD